MVRQELAEGQASKQLQVRFPLTGLFPPSKILLVGIRGFVAGSIFGALLGRVIQRRPFFGNF